MVHSILVRIAIVITALVVTARAWLPVEARSQKEWLRQHIEYVDANPQPLSPALTEFEQFIENNTYVNVLLSEMLEQVPYAENPVNQTEVRSVNQLLQVLNRVLSISPPWSNTYNNAGFAGSLISVILDYPLNTPAGYAVFILPEINKRIKNVLNEWGRFLASPASAVILNESEQGWFGSDALKVVMQVANEPYKTNYTFAEAFQSEPNAKHYGFTSWDNYFTRFFRDGIRPVADPDDDNVIANACESQTFRVSHNVQLRNKFWIKGTPYSVSDMLAHDELAHNFANGTVYQAYLSSVSYHRWHSPVSGRVVKAFVTDGTYFSVPLSKNGTTDYPVEPLAGLVGMGYMTAVATRAIIFIEADNPAIGLMAFIAVGQFDVSTVEITVKEGEHIVKGQQTGMFHFGGSTHVLMFRPDVKLEGFPTPPPLDGPTVNIPVRGKLATVQP